MSWDEWVYLAEAPALPASLTLYKELQQLGFTIFLLTGRDESQRNITVKNLQYAGYSNWKRLILRYAAYLMMGTTFFLLFDEKDGYLIKDI